MAGVGIWVVDGELDIEMSEVAPPEAFRDVQSVSRWMTGEVAPRLAIEAGCFDYQCIRVQPANGVP